MFTDEVCIRNSFVITTDISIDVVMDKFYRKFEDEFRERSEGVLTDFWPKQLGVRQNFAGH
jgi:hypothetical protein